MAATADLGKSDAQPRKMPRDERRVQLIEATISVLAAKGISRATMSEVARAAGLSHGLVNFHFQSKENLLLETLLYLAEEYRQNWTEALSKTGNGAAEQIHALICADFNPRICTPERLATWCTFWGEAQSRPIYQARCGANDEDYNAHMEAIVARLLAEYDYPGQAPRIARALRVTVEGMWLDMMTMSSPYSPEEALATVMSTAGAFFPRHFDETGLIGADK
jgi:AcrR family transcriptional regulator